MFRLNPLVRIRPGFSKVHLRDVPKLLFRKAVRSDRMVIEIPYPGIGDHLFYSPLPELLTQNNICKDVFVSSKSAFRTPEMYDLIWGSNPFIRGRIDEFGWSNTGFRPEGGNFLDGIVYQFSGVIPKLGSTTPKLYLETKRPVEPASPYLILDFNRISNQHRIAMEAVEKVLRSHLEKLGTSLKIVVYESLFLKELIASNPPFAALLKSRDFEVRRSEPTLANYFSIIEHCDVFFGFYSGGANVAAAYNRRSFIFCERKDPAISFLNQTYIETA
jgi:hypothetical protein